ncbi:MAG: TldD/PmbA family protein [Planctomycetota bacterium]
MFDKMGKLLESIEADYADIRYEVKKQSTIVFNGKDLVEIGSNSADGFVVRCLKGGGFSTVTFSSPDDAEKAIRRVQENAALIAKKGGKVTEFAPVEPVVDTVAPDQNEDPRKVSIEEKLDMVRKYNGIPLAFDQIATITSEYSDTTREKYFINTEGSRIREDLVTSRFSGNIMSSRGALSQLVRFAAGGSHGFSTIRDQEKYMEDRTKIVIDLLDAEPVKAGTYNCVLNNSMAGVFTHEAFGHFSEADIIEKLPAMRERMELGVKLGSDVLNIVDNATLPDQLGRYKYDDEGVAVREVQLIRDGVLTGRLHSRRTAAFFGEPVSGHAIAEDYRYPPIIRMGTIMIEPGEKSFEDLLAALGDGYYFLDHKGGQTAGENFSFGAQYGYRVENGKLGKMVRDINISGNLYTTLKEIREIGNDLILHKAGGCGKGQTNPRSCHGGPHIIIDGLIVGGV